MLVIGTAGHIDHGKSAIVKQLTGSDPDRLPEEKLRGMTIDLGFAFRGSDSEHPVAFVDVPGHERFVRNMIAGVGGIDMVMLVIAADDGWMPQSQEHFQIVRLLGIEHGLIVINKIDLAEKEWLDLLEEEIREKVAGSFLDDTPVFRVSAQTGEGLDKLGDFLDRAAGEVAVRRDIGKARLYIDRSFVLTGIGGVVTGTMRGGSISVGQTVAVWPSGETGKVRSLRANNREVTTADPGFRTALTLSGIDKEHLRRGGVIVDRLDFDHWRNHPILALSVELLPEAKVPLADRRRLLFITGTTEVEGDIRVLGSRQINAGESGIVFFRPDEPVYSLLGDHFIFRLPTPMVTLGGGRVLDHIDRLPFRREAEHFEYLKQRLSGELDALILTELGKTVMINSGALLEHASHARSAIASAVTGLLKTGTVGEFNSNLYCVRHLEQLADIFEAKANEFLKKHPHLKGLTRDQVSEFSSTRGGQADDLISWLIHTGRLVRLGDRFNLVGRGMSLKGSIKTAHDQIIAAMKENPFTPPRLQVLAKEGKDHRQAIKFIIDSGEGYKCGSEFLFLTEAWEQIIAYIKEVLKTTGKLKVGDLKERFGISRKFAIPILEETDRLKLTERDGDVRIKGAKFGD